MFQVGEKVRHWSGDVGTIISIGSGIIFVRYPDGCHSQCKLDGMSIVGNNQVITKLTKLELALQ